MKTQVGQITYALYLLLLTPAVFPVWSALGQTNTLPPSQPQPRQQRPRPNELMLPGGAARFAFGPDRLFALLTPEQRASLREVAGEERGKMRVVEEKVREARRALYQSGLLDKFDEEAVRKKAKAVAELDAELTVLRLKILSQVKPPLSAEQLQKLSASPAPEAPGGQSQGDDQRQRRPDFQRDEHGLPPKDRVASEPK